MQEKYGFVYIWFDKKRKRFYIGSHWGTEDDGYICSSNWMRDAYRKRKSDFKRKIICRIYTSRKETFDKESYYLNFIKEYELGKRYYNLCKNVKGHWSTDPEKVIKMKTLHKFKIVSEESKKKMSIAKLGNPSPNKGKKFMSEKAKEKIRQFNLGKKLSEDTINKMKNRKHSEETKKKMSESRKNIYKQIRRNNMSFQFTLDILNKIAPAGKQSVKASLVDPLNKWLPQYEINTLLRLEHFIGQAAEETDSFNTLKEYASGREYEGRHDLGNVQPGDGVRYKGRGIFQLTGRANYKRIGDILGVDLINHPELAETADIAVRTACEYWKTHSLNKYADDDDVETITRRINGGLNGFAQRQAFVDKADDILSPFFPDA